MENIYINDRVFFEDFKSSKVIYGELKDITMRANRSLVYVVESNDTIKNLLIRSKKKWGI